MARTTTSKPRTTTTARKPKPKVLPGTANGGKGKGGIVVQHGVTTTGYQRGCRCDLCKAAAADYDRRYRERKAAEKAEAGKKPAATRKPTTRKAATKKTRARS